MRKAALSLSVLFAGITALLSSCSGCKEKGSVIDFGQGAVNKDTTYMAAAETPEARRVLIEEFTGVTCPNCPQGHQVITSIENQNPGRIIAIGYYIFGQGQTKPIDGLTKQDFRTQDATDLANSTFTTIPFLPSASVDRSKDGSGDYIFNRNVWQTRVSGRLSGSTATSPVNMKLTSSFDESSRMATFKVHIAFTQSLTKKVKLSIVILEDNIIDAQENGSEIDTFYVHRHVMRDMVTSAVGDPVLTTFPTIESGRVYERTLSYKFLQANWDPKHCKVVAFLSSDETGEKEVFQAVEAEVAQ